LAAGRRRQAKKAGIDPARIIVHEQFPVSFEFRVRTAYQKFQSCVSSVVSQL
jgi:hypothetical protein